MKALTSAIGVKDLRRIIERLVAAALPSMTDPRVRQAVQLSGALPIELGMSGVTLLSTSGDVLFVPWESDGAPTPLNDKVLKRAALVLAAQEHPELKALLPSRPEDSRSCPRCGGSGLIAALAREPPFRCGECGGVGWLD